MYTEYNYTEADTFESVAKFYGITVSKLLESNGISIPCKYRKIADYYRSLSNIGAYYQPYIFIPTVGSGGDTINIPTYELLVRKAKGTRWDTPEANYSAISSGCSITVGGKTLAFPCFPETVSESVSSSFSGETPLGRNEPMYVYQNSGPRQVSVSFRMHREMFSSLSGIDSLINLIESGVYANKDGVPPKRVTLKIGGQIYISGIINGTVNVEWSETLNAHSGWSAAKYNIATVSFSVDEVTGGHPTKAGW